jgi:FkbM family methyltransferase
MRRRRTNRRRDPSGCRVPPPAVAAARRPGRGRRRAPTPAGAGAAAALARAIARPVRGAIEVHLPRFGAPLLLRSGTSDIPTFEQVFVNEEYALPFVRIKPALVIDAGANIGLSVRYLAARFPAARLVAIEPEASNFAILRRNTRALRAVTLLQAAVWNRETPLTIANPDDEKWAFQVREATGGRVSAVTIGSLLASASARERVVVKLDIEGAEIEVLDASAAGWLPKVDVLIVELHDRFRPGCTAALERAVAGLGFREHVSGENLVLVRGRPRR